jgi:hypothetical protein
MLEMLTEQLEQVPEQERAKALVAMALEYVDGYSAESKALVVQFTEGILLLAGVHDGFPEPE